MKIDIENNTILIYAKTPEAAKEARHVRFVKAGLIENC